MLIDIIKFLRDYRYFDCYNRELKEIDKDTVKISYPTVKGRKTVQLPSTISLNENIGWFFGLWVGDKSSDGFGICNKDFNVLKKSLQVMKFLKQPLDIIRAKVCHNNSFTNFKEIESKIKGFGIKNFSFHKSSSKKCGEYCIYLYNYNAVLRFIFKTLLTNFENSYLLLDKQAIYSILSGIFDAEGTTSLTYNYIAVEFKTGTKEGAILIKLLNLIGIRYNKVLKKNGMMAVKIGECKKDKIFLKEFYENTKKHLVHYKKLNIQKIIENRECFYKHDAFYLFYILLHPGCSMKDIREGFGKKSRWYTTLKLKNFVNDGYLKVSKFKRKNIYYITIKGRKFVSDNLQLILQIADVCKIRGKWGKGPIFRSSSFINEFANRNYIKVVPR